MKKTVYFCDLCEHEIREDDRHDHHSCTAIAMKVKYYTDPVIDKKSKKKIHICPTCISEIARRIPNETKTD